MKKATPPQNRNRPDRTSPHADAGAVRPAALLAAASGVLAGTLGSLGPRHVRADEDWIQRQCWTIDAPISMKAVTDVARGGADVAPIPVQLSNDMIGDFSKYYGPDGNPDINVPKLWQSLSSYVDGMRGKTPPGNSSEEEKFRFARTKQFLVDARDAVAGHIEIVKQTAARAAYCQQYPGTGLSWILLPGAPTQAEHDTDREVARETARRLYGLIFSDTVQLQERAKQLDQLLGESNFTPKLEGDLNRVRASSARLLCKMTARKEPADVKISLQCEET